MLSAIGVKQPREKITNEIERIPDDGDIRKAHLRDIHSMLVYYEDAYHKLKEATSMLELAL